MNPLNNKRAIVIDDSDLNQPESVQEGTKSVKVNPNYLKLYALYDIKGKRIQVSKNEKSIVLCVPTTRKKYIKALIKYIKYTTKKSLGYVLKIKLYYTLENKNEKFLNISTGKKLNNQTIFISTSKNSSFINRNIMDGQGKEDGLKIPVKGSLSGMYNSIKPLLEKNNYADNYLQLVRLKDIPEEQLKLGIGNVIAQSILVLTGFLITFILIIHVTLLFFRVFKHSIIVKRINGFSKALSYKELWFLTVFQYTVMLSMLGFQGILNTEKMVSLVVIATLEIVINLNTINHLENKNMGNVINGE